MYKLKLKNEREIRRIGLSELRFALLEQQVANLFGGEYRDSKLTYLDEEADEILISSDEELQAAYDSMLAHVAALANTQNPRSETLVLNVVKKNVTSISTPRSSPAATTPITTTSSQNQTSLYPQLPQYDSQHQTPRTNLNNINVNSTPSNITTFNPNLNSNANVSASVNTNANVNTSAPPPANPAPPAPSPYQGSPDNNGQQNHQGTQFNQGNSDTTQGYPFNRHNHQHRQQPHRHQRQFQAYPDEFLPWCPQGLNWEAFGEQFFTFTHGYHRIHAGLREGFSQLIDLPIKKVFKVIILLFLLTFFVLPITYHLAAAVFHVGFMLLRIVFCWFLFKFAIKFLRFGTRQLNERLIIT